MTERIGARRQSLSGFDALVPEGFVHDARVIIDDGRIVSIEGGVCTDAPQPSADLLLPGMVDIHGDAFERAICPRPGVRLPLDLALAENDAWLLAAGITTFFYSITDSFEPGLRSRDQVRSVMTALVDDANGPDLRCDTRVHIRHEVCLTDGQDELLDWMRSKRVQLLSIADHLPGADDPVTLERYRRGVARRVTMSDGDLLALIASAIDNRSLGHRQQGVLCAEAQRLGIPLASHDDVDANAVDAAIDRGVSICEFPMTLAAAQRARSRGVAVLMGAPNFVRGGSHVNALGVAEALANGAVNCLCSDYHYPSLFRAPFQLAHCGLPGMTFPLAMAWDLVSDAPARAAGLAGRKGRIALNHDADLLLLESGRRLASVWIAGRQVAAWP
jgi:alpha-D-ribose 1-methylphosphonate 5-triphosphate diphosphatase